MSKPLSQTESAEFRERLRKQWGWDGTYWYPLKPQDHPDLIGFDVAVLKTKLPEEALRRCLEALTPNGVLMSSNAFANPPHLQNYLADAIANVASLTGEGD